MFLNISHKESLLYVWFPDNEMWDMTDGDQMILENFHFLSSHKTLLKERKDNLLFSKILKFWQFKFKSNFYHNENDHFSKLEKQFHKIQI